MEDEGPTAPPASESLVSRKRARDAGDLKRVAEIVIVLSVMGQMRGGKLPTAPEKALLAEARERLAAMCEGVKPKELFSREAVMVLVEDLGLNRSKDSVLGFRPPKMSIAEKFLLTKKKMQESKEQSSAYSPQRLPASFGGKSDLRGSLAHDAPRFMQDKSPVVTSARGFQNASPIAHVPVPISAAPSLKQPHTNDVPAGISPVKQASSCLERGSPSAYIGSNARPDGPSYLAQVPAGNIPQKIPTISSVQSTASVAKIVLANKSLDHISVKSEGNPGVSAVQSSHQTMRNPETKPSIIQSGRGGPHIAHQSPQGLTFDHTPALLSNHNDIAKSVQRILQSEVADHASWIPPSTKYMDATLNCQICNNTITDIESLLVCDSCEKGNHLKCLQSYGNKGIPKAEWHCPRCLASNNGKPLLPKYGRVMRAPVGAPNAASNVSRTHSSSEKRTEDLDSNVNQQKAMGNGSSDVSQHAFMNEGVNHCESTPRSRTIGAEVQVILPTIGIKREDKTCNAIGGNHLKEIAGALCTSPGRHSENPNNIENDRSSPTDIKPTSESVFQPSAAPENSHENSHDVVVGSDHLCVASPQDCDQVNLSSNVDASANQLHENTKPGKSEPKEALGGKELPESMDGCSAKLSNEGSSQSTADGTLVFRDETKDCGASSYDLHIVEWIGDVIQVVGEKTYYLSCRVDGVLQNLQDHVLIVSSGQKFVPSKLESLWEDNLSGSKWADVTPYYFPSDLPEVASLPSTAENSEVYASSTIRTVMAGLICGTCEVIPSDRFTKESNRRKKLSDADTGLCPIFICKWMFDESKGLFQSITS